MIIMTDNNIDCVRISSMQISSKTLLSLLLNPTKLIATDNGLPRDWRGLASLVKIPGELTPAILSSPDPTAYVLKLWSKSNPEANLKDLQMHLETLDRFDVIDDTKELFENEAKNYKESNNNIQVTLSDKDSNYLTVDDAILAEQGSSHLQTYDAFVLYADEDIDFVTELVKRMEGYGFKFCIKDRDLLGGLSSQHSAVLRLIAERCARLLLILSPSFVQSPEKAFFYQFAQALGIDQRQRKIVPVLYKKCILPPELSYYFLLDFQRSGNGRLWNFWDKLRDSLRVAPLTPKLTASEFRPTKTSAENSEVENLPESENQQTPSAPLDINSQYTGSSNESQSYLNNSLVLPQVSSSVHISDVNYLSLPDVSSSSLSLNSAGSSKANNSYNDTLLSHSKKHSKSKSWLMNLIKPSTSSVSVNGGSPETVPKVKKRKWLKKRTLTPAT